MSNSQESGFVEYMLIALWCVFIGLGTFWLLQAYQYNGVLNRWTAACYRSGGVVQISGSDLVDCFIGGKPCQVSGFQAYETTNPNPAFNNLPLCQEAVTHE